MTIFEELGIMDVRTNTEDLAEDVHSTVELTSKSLFSINESENRLRRYDSYGWEHFNAVFLSEIAEYIVDGDVSQDSSWQKGRQFLPP